LNLDTENAIYNLTHKILEGLHKKEYPLRIFCDLSKAFDSVDHSIILRKLHHYGIRGVSLNWFQSYLAGRSQLVRILSQGILTVLGTEPVKKGAPQGSILGPLLFTIYVNNLSVNITGDVTQFADDTSVILSDQPGINFSESIEAVMLELKKWFDNNNLKLNSTKTTPFTLLNKPVPNF